MSAKLDEFRAQPYWIRRYWPACPGKVKSFRGNMTRRWAK